LPSLGKLSADFNRERACLRLPKGLLRSKVMKIEGSRPVDSTRFARAQRASGSSTFTPEMPHEARATAQAHGGWMLREAGGPTDDDGYGIPLPNAAVMRRIKDAFDPEGNLNPGRTPLGTS